MFAAPQLRFVLRCTIFGLVMFSTLILEAQDADTTVRPKGADFSGAGNLVLSSDGKQAAGLSVLDGNNEPGSLVKIWSIETKELLHQFRVPGKAHAVAFNSDGSAVAAADRVGNLASTSTIRVWDLSNEKEWTVGTCAGEVGVLSFSADSIQLAAATRHSYFDYTSALTESDVVCACQIKVWRVDGSMKQLSINIPHPLGE